MHAMHCCKAILYIIILSHGYLQRLRLMCCRGACWLCGWQTQQTDVCVQLRKCQTTCAVSTRPRMLHLCGPSPHVTTATSVRWPCSRKGCCHPSLGMTARHVRCRAIFHRGTAWA